MEQLFKLEKELQQGKKDMSVIKNDVKHLEVKLKQQEIGLQRHATKTMVYILWQIQVIWFNLEERQNVHVKAKLCFLSSPSW